MKKYIFIIASLLIYSCNNGKIVKEYYRDGSLKSETLIVNGLKNGTAKQYYNNGQLFYICHYKNDTMFGPYQEYAPSGKLKSSAFFWRDRPVGPIYYNFNDGSLELYNERDYDSAVYYIKKYDTLGKLIKEEGVCISPSIVENIKNDSIKVNSNYNARFFYAEPNGYSNFIKAYYNNAPMNISFTDAHMGIIEAHINKPGWFTIRISSILKDSSNNLLDSNSIFIKKYAFDASR